MSKKILAALLAVLMVVSILPMSAAAAINPEKPEVVPANLTAEGATGPAPAYGHAGTYQTTLGKDTNGNNVINVTIRELGKSITQGSMADASQAKYAVGVGIAIADTNKIWARKFTGGLPEDITTNKDWYWFWPNDPKYGVFRQDVDGQTYATFYTTAGTAEELNGQVLYIAMVTKDPSGGMTEEVRATFKSYKVVFDVSASTEMYTLTVDPDITGGTIDVEAGDTTITSTGSVAKNELVIVTPKPDIAKKIKKVFYKEEGSDEKHEVTVNSSLAGQYAFSMPNKNVTVSAEFEDGEPFTITKEEPEHGSITVANSAAYNTAVAIDVTPDNGYEVTEVYYKNGDDETKNPVYLVGDGYSFTMPANNVKVGATFTPIPQPAAHAVTVSDSLAEGARIDVSPARPKTGEQVTLTITPPTGKKIINVTGTNGATPARQEGNVYVFAMPDSDVEVNATFEAITDAHQKMVSIETPTAAEGTITLSPEVEGNKYVVGDVVTVNVAPANGKVVKAVKVAVGGAAATELPLLNGTYSFTVTDATTVSAEFDDLALYTVTCNPSSSGTVTSSKTEAMEGDPITITVTPNSGYSVQSVTVTDGSTTIASSETGTCNFTMPAANVTVTATFRRTGGGSSGGSSSSGTTGSVSVTKPANGTVASNVSTAKEGDKVTVTVTPDASYYVVTGVTASGDSGTIRATKNADGTYSFTMPAGNVTVNTTIRHIYDLFTDVPSDIAEYGTAIKWAVEKNITLGTDPANYSTFGPYSPCTRAQMVVFLYRAAGSPAVTGTNSFTDLPSDSEIQKAVQWAVSKDITKGTSAATFDPYAPCTRGQMVTFLHRNHSEPAAAGSNSFADVSADAFYKTAVQWAVNSGVTKGTSDTTFDPDSACTRVQMVTFLYRDMGK